MPPGGHPFGWKQHQNEISPIQSPTAQISSNFKIAYIGGPLTFQGLIPTERGGTTHLPTLFRGKETGQKQYDSI